MTQSIFDMVDLQKEIDSWPDVVGLPDPFPVTSVTRLPDDPPRKAHTITSNSKYPFAGMAVGDYKQVRYKELRSAKAARAAAYGLGLSRCWKFKVTISEVPLDDKGRKYWVQVWRLADVGVPVSTQYIDCKFKGAATYDLVKGIKHNEVIRVDFLYGRDMQRFKEVVNHPAFNGTKLLRIRKELNTCRLIVSTTYIDQKRIPGVKPKRTGKYPFNTLEVGEHIKFDLGGVSGLAHKIELARKAAYVLAGSRGWKFETKAQGSCLHVWRIG